MGSREQNDPIMKSGASSRAPYFNSKCSQLHPIQVELRKITDNYPRGTMLSCADGSLLLSNMLKFANARKCIDVGVFTGYSTLTWAMAVPNDGVVVACDVSLEHAQIGMPYWKKAGVEHKIDLRIAPAVETLQSLIDAGQEGTFDFVFIDADKSNYVKYYELAVKLLRTNGIIAVDNTWWNGLVMAGENSDDTNSIRELVERMATDERVTTVMLDVGDGITVCLKN